MVPALFRTAWPDFLGAIITFQSPLEAVAVWARISLLTHSIVSPTFAETLAGAKTSLSIVMRIVPGNAGVENPTHTAPAHKTARPHATIARSSISSRRRHARHAADAPERS